MDEYLQKHSWPGNVRELENTIKTLLAVDDEDLVLQAIGVPDVWPAEDAQQITSHSRRKGSTSNNDQSRNGKQQDEGNTVATTAVVSVSLKDASRTASRVAEKILISEVLQRPSWNRKRAAKELNISYKALLYKLKQNGLSDPRATEQE